MTELRRRQRGNALIETAVVCMFAVTILLGILGFGRIMQADLKLKSAVREGARLATVGADNLDIRDAILKNLTATGDPAQVVGEVAIFLDPMDETARVFNSNVRVQVWWNYTVPVPLFSLIMNKRMLYAEETMVVTVGT